MNFRNFARAILALSLCALASAAVASADEANRPGVASLNVGAPDSRALALTLWYPAEGGQPIDFAGNAVFRGNAALQGALLPDGRLPLVLVSHGGLRSADDSGAWLAAGLARAGFIAAEVNAPRPADAAAARDEIWRRPEDLRRALDAILADPLWSEHIDPARISVVGYALGGTAALALAGHPLDAEAFRASCDAGATGNPDCPWYDAAGVSLRDADLTALAEGLTETRLAGAVALAPELLPVVTPAPESATPALILTLGAETAAPGPALPQAARANLPGAEVSDAFALCTDEGPEILAADDGDPDLCGSGAEAREAAHAAILASIVGFLQALPRP